MTTYNDRLSLVSFLRSCSRIALEDFLLAKQNRISNLEKELRDMIGRLSENIAFVELANILREFERSNQGLGVDDSMSWKASGAAKEIRQGREGQRIGMGDKLVLMILSDYFDESTGYAWPSQKVLAEQCICTERGVRKILEKLETVGLIEIEHRGDKGNRYRLLFNPKGGSVMRNVVPHQVKLYEERGFLNMRNPGSSKPPLSHQVSSRSGFGSTSTKERNGDLLRRQSAPLDDDTLSKSLLEKFKTDPRFPALDIWHIQFAIEKIRERASTPPVTIKYWEISVERFLVDMPHEWKAAQREDSNPDRIGQGPVLAEEASRRLRDKLAK